jgi:hypothetical protein
MKDEAVGVERRTQLGDVPVEEEARCAEHATADFARRKSLDDPDERSVWLGSESLRLSAKIDLLEGEGRRVTPVDYKRGKRPHVPRGAYEPELVQVC